VISKQQMEENKKIILKLLNKCPRLVESEFIDHLKKETDFFTAPASTKYHNNIPGGLADHSLNVYRLFREKCKRYKITRLNLESQRIVSLLHDISKTNNYREDFVWRKDDNNQWYQKPCWVCKYTHRTIHGATSNYLLTDFFKLTQLERTAIELHMGPYYLDNKYDYLNAVKIVPEAALLHHADHEACILFEKIYDEYNGQVFEGLKEYYDKNRNSGK